MRFSIHIQQYSLAVSEKEFINSKSISSCVQFNFQLLLNYRLFFVLSSYFEFEFVFVLLLVNLNFVWFCSRWVFFCGARVCHALHHSNCIESEHQLNSLASTDMIRIEDTMRARCENCVKCYAYNPNKLQLDKIS